MTNPWGSPTSASKCTRSVMLLASWDAIARAMGHPLASQNRIEQAVEIYGNLCFFAAGYPILGNIYWNYDQIRRIYIYTYIYIYIYNIYTYIYICIYGKGWTKLWKWWKSVERYGNISWDDDIPNIWKHKIHVPNHQPGKYMELYGNIWKQTIHMVTNIWKWVIETLMVGRINLSGRDANPALTIANKKL